MASLVDRNGTYYAQWTDNTRKPARRRLSLKTSDRRTAKKLLQELDNAYTLSNWDPWVEAVEEFYDRPTEFKSILSVRDLFLAEKRQDGLSNQTIKLYKSDIGLLVEKLGKDILLERLKASQISSFVKEGALARITQRKRYRVLRAFLNWATRKEHLRDNPIERVSIPKKKDRLPRSASIEEITEICNSIEADYRKKVSCSDPRDTCKEGDLIWMIPLIWFGLYTGMRVSELGRLRWKHIDQKNNLIYILKQKNGKQQTIPLNSKAKEVLDSLDQVNRNEYLFGSPRGNPIKRSVRAFVTRVNKLFLRYRRAAGVREEVTFHSTRHAFCTMLAEAGCSGVVIKEAARHADISTSMRYVHLSNQHLKAELDDVFA